MIYETAIVVAADADEATIEKVTNKFKEVVDASGEVIISDNWGIKSFGQATARGVRKGTYLFFMYSADANANTEIERRLKIEESVLKYVIVKLGEVEKKEQFVKGYKKPGTQVSLEEKRDADKEKRLYAKKRTCWFTANKTSPDWKDPMTYAWLVNEFGKISPARVTGLSPKFQRKATKAIKIGRNVGLISYISNHIAR